MSRSIYYDTRDHLDNVHDVSHGCRISYYDDFEDSQTVAASSVPPAGPWSPYNTRHETDFPSPYATSTLSSDTHALNNLDGHHTEALGGAFISYQSDPRYNSPYAAPQSSRSHPPSPLPAPSWTGTSISILPSTILTSYHASSILPSTTPEGYHDSNNSIQCKHCSQWFHGKYCHGNLARHVKHQHTGSHERPFACTAAGCSKTFRRQDARLKHARNKHPGLSLPPVPRRRFEGSEQHPRAPDASVLVPAALNLDYNVGQWSYADQVFDSHHMSKPVHETPLASIRDESACPAHYIFTALRANLEPVEYNRVRDSFFTRWESIVQQLGDDHSDIYPAYAKVLEDIHAVVEAVECDNTSNVCGVGPCAFQSRAPHSQRAESRGNGGLGLGSGIATSENRVSKPYDRKSSLAKGSGKNKSTVLAEQKVKAGGAKVDCPVFMHHLMRGTTPPCSGCREGCMAHVRAHLQTTGRAAGTHAVHPAFVKQCSRCKKDFIDETAYHNHPVVDGCDSHPQHRGQIEVPWARLYLTLYPNESRVPLPWVGQRGWLPDWIVAQCRSALGATAASSPFLDNEPGSSSAHAQTPNNPPGYDAATGFMLQDVVAPTYIQSDHMATPVLNPYRPDPFVQAGSIPNGFPGNNLDHWQNVLRSSSTHREALIEAAMYLTPEQLRVITDEAAHMHFLAVSAEQRLNSTRTAPEQYQPYQLHQDQPQFSAPLGSNVQQYVSEHHVYTTPAQPYFPPATAYYTTPSSNTQPSSVYYDTSSSRQPTSNFTGPSSTLDPTLLSSPWSPSNHRRTSLPTDDIQDALRRSRPSRISLPEAHGQSPYMNPSAPDTPDDDFLQLPRRLFDGR